MKLNSKSCFPVCASAVVLALFVGGCATPSQPSAMVVAAETTTQHPYSVSIAVTGGGETSSMGASNISSSDFAEAIRKSITESKLFAQIMDGAAASDYQLEVQIVRLDRPSFGTSFTVNLEATWRLVHRADQQVVWEKAVMSSFTATMGDAFAGVKRLRLANEGAARNNIASAIREMSALQLR